jgi:hypothetical protein
MLRERLRSARRNAPLFDTPARIRAIEKALEHMHRRAVEGGTPETFEITRA